jgi:hypothetical protein
MKILEKLFLVGLTTFIFSIRPSLAQESKKPTLENIFYVDSSKINYYPKKQNEFHFIFNTGKIKVNKKITLADPEEYSKYANLINPESIKYFTRRINSRGKSPSRIAEESFYALKKHGIKYMPDPLDPGLPGVSYEDYYEYLDARLLNGEDERMIFIKPKDYLKDSGQTLEDNGGDCEELAGLFCSCLSSKKIPTAIVYLTRKDSLGEEVAHISSLFMSGLEKGRKPKYGVIFPDSNVWIPLDATYIPEHSFKEAIKRGFENFKEYETYKILLLK